MIRKLRLKFIIIAMCSVTIVLLFIMGFINLLNYNRINSNAAEILQVLSSNEGTFPKPDEQPVGLPRHMQPETPYETRFFTVLVSSAGEISQLNTRSVAAITTDEAVEYARRAWTQGRASGSDGAYKYLATPTGEGTFIVFLDYSRDLNSFRSFLMTSIVVSVAGIAAVFVLVLIFSGIAVKPVAESYEKQKRFITDASHEIKTPLTIIDANTEVLEISSGENEWTRSIKNQVQRLSDLTASLIVLTRMDETGSKLSKQVFSLTDAVEDSLEPFISLAGPRHKAFDLAIEQDINYEGNEALIRQLVSILADNAVKYSSENSLISVGLRRQGKNYELVFCNQTDQIDKGRLNQIFERFYRMDGSRNSTTGGHGIGLSAAKSIVLAHKGRIQAESPDGKAMVITVQL